MIDISSKIKTKRKAIAEAVVLVSKQETIEAIKSKTVPKGDVFEASRIAGLFAIKRTSDMIPDCHPLPVEFASIKHNISGLEIKIEVEVHTIYKTGVEVEAMHGASVVALTIYDMLKPIDKRIEIRNIRLISKSGGKSQYNEKPGRDLLTAVIVCSDSITAGKKKDSSGKAIIAKLEQLNLKTKSYVIIADDVKTIQQKITEYCNEKYDIVIITGGTGLSPTDVTPEAVLPLLDREIPGIAEAARSYGQEQLPYAMLSRSVAGLKGKTLILALPGSTSGAGECIDALFPYVLHLFKVADGGNHD